jgi:hypothetical protein
MRISTKGLKADAAPKLDITANSGGYRIFVCEACLDGEDGICHRPGCLFRQRPTPALVKGTWRELLRPYGDTEGGAE